MILTQQGMRGFAARQYANSPLTFAQRRGSRAVLTGSAVSLFSVRIALRDKGSPLVATLEESVATEAETSFADMRLSPQTLQALARMGIETPTPIQSQTLPALLDGRDVIGQARTGSGKTLAFGIPAIEGVDVRQRVTQVLVLTPTRELAIQVGGVIEEVGRAKGVSVGLIFGGRAMGPQRDMLRKGAHIIVGTPGRVLDLLSQGALRLDKIRFLVLDEADEMLDRGFAPDVEKIIARASTARQTALFSATLADWVRKTADKHMDDPIEVKVDPNPEDAAPIEHIAYDLQDNDKLSALKDLLDHRSGEGSIIVFGRTKHGVKSLARKLQADGYPVAALQGNLSQNARDQVVADFRSRAVPILLATNVAARGLDVTHVEQVINVELPESPELLTHRIGRTGRMGRPGQAITLLSRDDGAKWRQLERGLLRRIPRAPWRGAAAAISANPDDVDTSYKPEPVGRSQPESSGRATNSRGGGQPRRAAPEEYAMERGPAPRHGRSNGTSRPVQTPDRYADSRTTPSRSQSIFGPRPDSRRPRAGSVIADPSGRVILGTEFRELTSATVHDDSRSLTTSAHVNGGSGTRTSRTSRDARTGGAATRTPAAPRQATQIVCSECGTQTSVPFAPDPTRPVYCSDCFGRRAGARR